MIKKAVMNDLIKRMAKKQNKKKKLNAGQLREAVRLFLSAVIEKANEGEVTSIALQELAKAAK